VYAGQQGMIVNLFSTFLKAYAIQRIHHYEVGPLQ
jgi:hypothetical protein